MRTSWEIFKRDINRISKNGIAIFVIIAVCFVPSIYAWFNIGANMDPYGHTDGIKVGVCILDKGTTHEKTGYINAGDSLEEAIRDNKDIGWRFLDEDVAIEKVRSGEIYAALIVPESFSEDMISFVNGQTKNPEIRYYVNEKKNAIAPKVTNTGATTIQNQIGNSFRSLVAEAVAKALKEAGGEIVTNVNNGSVNINSALDDIIHDLNKIKTINGKMENSGDNLIALSRDVSAKADKINNEVKKAQGTQPDLDREYNEKYKTFTETLSCLETCLGQNKTTLGEINKLADALIRQAESMKNSVSGISSAQTFKYLAETNNISEAEIAAFVAEPVEIKAESFYKVRDYGSGMAPFYTNLAIWVVGLVLIALVHTEVERDKNNELLRNITPVQAYFGRWMLYVAWGLLQTLVICLGDIFIVNIQCKHPVAFVVAGLVAGFVYVSIIYALTVTFKHIGKALAVILVILQIPGSGGSYPVEMTAHFFQVIHPLLPFKYGINAMREAVAGYYGSEYIRNLGILMIFFLISLLIGIPGRSLLLNINRIFDIRLAETGIVICEENPMELDTTRYERTARIIIREFSATKKLEERLLEFEKTYKKKQQKGITMIIIMPVLLLLLMLIMDSNSKMAFLIIWIICIIAVAGYLLITEYIHTKYIEEKELLEDRKRKTVEEGGAENARP